MAFLQIFLDIIQTGVDTAGAASEASGADSVTILDLILKGGLVMYPLILLSIIAVYLIVERLLTLRKADKDPEDFLEELSNYVTQGDLNSAKNLCKKYDTPFSRMLEKGVAKLGKPLSTIEASIQNVGRIEIYKLERNLNALATISGAGPMIGFLGTVTGMVQAFIAIAQAEGTISPKLLSNGIYEAMITTVAGLIVGIIAYIGYNYLTGKVEKIVHQMEYSSIEFIELLQEPR
jgi:biopolymer transport protein ExbB